METDTIDFRIQEHQLTDGSVVSDLVLRGPDGFLTLPGVSSGDTLKMYYAIQGIITQHSLANVRDN